MFAGLPGLNFKLFGFPVTIGVDFAILALLLSVRARPDALYLFEWLVVLTFSILLHELGHAFAFLRYSIHPHIRLWGLGGLTISGFPLPPRKSIVVSVAGPAVGIALGEFVLVMARWLPPDQLFLNQLAADLVYVNLGWAILNLLPIAGLDGGNTVESLFLVVRGERGRRPGLRLVAVSSIAIAVLAVFSGFLYLGLIVLVFALMNPAPYLELWRVVGPSGMGRRFGSPDVGRAETWHLDQRAGEPVTESDDEYVPRRRGGRLIVGVGPEVRRRFGEAYAETLHEPVDLDELEQRPEPLLAEVAEMLHRRDDRSVAERLAAEEDELSVLAIAARAVEAGRANKLVAALAAVGRSDRRGGRGSAAEVAPAALRLQVALHALGRYEESIAAGRLAVAFGTTTPQTWLLAARSAARHGDRKQTREALEEAERIGPPDVSDAALGDLARLGPDRDVAAVLARLRSSARR